MSAWFNASPSHSARTVQLAAARHLRSLGVPFISATLFGLFASVFVDLGPTYTYSTEYVHGAER